MRRLFTTFLVCAGVMLNAQVFSENFNSGVPGSMTQVTINGDVSWGPCGSNTGGAPCPIEGSGSATFFNASYTAYSTALVTPELDLSSGVYKVSFKHAQRSWGGDINQLFVEISTNGTSWTTMASYTEEVYNVTERSLFLSPYNPTATTKIRFRAVNKYGYRLILDEIKVEEVTTDDIALKSIDVEEILVQGSNQVKGTLRNEGANILTSFDVNWQADGGEVHTQTISGVSITPGQEFNFTHSDAWTPGPGNYNLKVWISNPNLTDSNAANDELTKAISVASGSTYKRPVYEKFSSSTCPPCYNFNINYFNGFFANYAHDKAVFVSYQVNWPGAGDPYYTTEVGNRVSYYGIDAAPTLLLNNQEGTFINTTLLQQHLDTILEEDVVGFFKVDADHEISGNNITVTAEILPYLSGNFIVHAIVIEKLTTGNVATNGETEFHHVFMKALPNMSGTTVNFIYDQPQTLTLTADLSSTHVEEMDDLAVVILVQNPANKKVMQAAYTESSGIQMGTSDVVSAQIALVPNPSTGIVHVLTDKAVDLKVIDLTGRSVFAQKSVKNNATLDLSHLGKGVYVVQFQNEEGSVVTKKLILK